MALQRSERESAVKMIVKKKIARVAAVRTLRPLSDDYATSTQAQQALNAPVINSTTGESQRNLLLLLQKLYSINGRQVWCIVKDVIPAGIVVTIMFQSCNLSDRYYLENCHMLWSDFPPAITHSLQLQERIQLTQQQLPIGTQFKAKIAKIHEDQVRLWPALHPQVILPVTYCESIRQQAVSFAAESAATVGKSVEHSCPWRFIVVLDFEATCDYGPNPVVTPQTSEIIEFPWVTIDLETLTIVDRVSLKVRPDNLDGITNFCTKLTSIDKSTVMSTDAMTLQQAIDEKFGDPTSGGSQSKKTGGHTRYLFQKFQGGGSAIVVTDGPWDLQMQLLMETTRKGILMEDWRYLNHYVDLKSVFIESFPWLNPYWRPSLDVMLQGMDHNWHERLRPTLTVAQAFRLQPSGKRHTGLGDAESIASIAVELIRRGCDFTQVRTVRKAFNPRFDSDLQLFSSHDPNAWFCQSCQVYNKSFSPLCRFCDAYRNAPVISSMDDFEFVSLGSIHRRFESIPETGVWYCHSQGSVMIIPGADQYSSPVSMHCVMCNGCKASPVCFACGHLETETDYRYWCRVKIINHETSIWAQLSNEGGQDLFDCEAAAYHFNPDKHGKNQEVMFVPLDLFFKVSKPEPTHPLSTTSSITVTLLRCCKIDFVAEKARLDAEITKLMAPT